MGIVIRGGDNVWAKESAFEIFIIFFLFFFVFLFFCIKGTDEGRRRGVCVGNERKYFYGASGLHRGGWK